MKREYEEPQLEVVKFNVVDVITSSSDADSVEWDQMITGQDSV